MSVFSPVKTIILANLSTTMPADLRKAVVESLDALDNDLDVGNYIPSSTADDKFEKFHTVLAGIDEIGKDNEESEDDDDDEESTVEAEDVTIENDDDDEDEEKVETVEGLDITPPVDDEEDD